MKNIIAITFFIFSTAISFSQTEKDWKTYETKNFKIGYFEPWELNTTGQNGTEFFLYYPLTSETDEFKENINLLVQDLTGRGIDLDAYVKNSENQVAAVMAGGKVIESSRKKGKKYDFHKFVFSGNQGEYSLKFQQYYWLIDEKAYILTFSAEIEEFEKLIKDGNAILNSFKID